MISKTAYTIFWKELTETLRDYRTLVPMILLPVVLYPALMLLVTQVAMVQITRIQAEEGVVAFGIGDMPEELVQVLERAEHVRVAKEPVESLAPLSDGTVQLIIQAQEGFDRVLREMGTAEIAIHYDRSQERSGFVKDRVLHELERYKQELLEQRLQKLKVAPAAIEPLQFKEENAASPARMTGFFLGKILPLLLIMALVLGAFYPAVDLTAGEKERKTLQTLLTAPVETNEVVAGKFLAVWAIAMLVGTLNLGSIALLFGQTQLLGVLPDHIHLDLSGPVLAMLFFTILVTALFFSAILMAVAVLARSFKEAQTYLTPVYLVSLLPAMLAQLPGMELTLATALVPGMNVSLVIQSLFVGSFSTTPVVLSLGSTLVYTLLCLGAAGYFFKREAVLLGDVSGIEALFGPVGPHRKVSLPGGGEALALYAVMFVLVLYVGQAMQSVSTLGGILFTPWILLFGGTWLWCRTRKWNVTETFQVRPTRPKAWIAASLLGLGAWSLAFPIVSWIETTFLPIPEELMQQAEALLKDQGSLATMLLMDFGITLSAGICEEWLFRGPILTGFRRTFPTWVAVVLTAVLFGALHLSLHRFTGTFVLGIFAGWIVVATGSIFPAMLFHATNNAVLLTMARATEGAADPTSVPYSILIPCMCMALAGTFLLARSKELRVPRSPDQHRNRELVQ